MTTWYLIIILSGYGEYNQQTVQFQNEQACTLVRDKLKTKYNSKNNYIECEKDN